jgi:hypothetical protein
MNMSASTKTGDIVRLMQGSRNFGGNLADMAFYLCNIKKIPAVLNISRQQV